MSPRHLQIRPRLYRHTEIPVLLLVSTAPFSVIAVILCPLLQPLPPHVVTETRPSVIGQLSRFTPSHIIAYRIFCHQIFRRITQIIVYADLFFFLSVLLSYSPDQTVSVIAVNLFLLCLFLLQFFRSALRIAVSPARYPVPVIVIRIHFRPLQILIVLSYQSVQRVIRIMPSSASDFL